MTELKPCPFCGGEAVIETREEQNIFSDIFFVGRVKCTNNDCGATIGLRLALEGAVNYWEKKNYIENSLAYRWNERTERMINNG